MDEATLLKVIKVVTGSEGGGVFTSEQAFTRELRRQGHEVVGLIAGVGNSAKVYMQLFNEGVVLRQFPDFGKHRLLKMMQIPRTLISGFLAARSLSRKMTVDPAKTVVAVRKPVLLPFAGEIGRKLNIPVFWHVPEVLENPFKRLIVKRLCLRYDVIPIGNSPYTSRRLGIDDQMVVYPTFDPAKILQGGESLRPHLQIPQNALVFGVAARLVREKGTDLVVRAFVRSKAFKDGAHLVIAGGPLEGKIGQYISEVSKTHGNGRIHLLGPWTDMAGFYLTINIAVNGRRNAEPFGISVIESLATGTPVIAYNLGGPSTTVRDGCNGWHVSDPTVEGYLEGFNRAYRDVGDLERFGDCAVRSVSNYLVSTQVSNYVRIALKGLKSRAKEEVIRRT